MEAGRGGREGGREGAKKGTRESGREEGEGVMLASLPCHRNTQRQLWEGGLLTRSVKAHACTVHLWGRRRRGRMRGAG